MNKEDSTKDLNQAKSATTQPTLETILERVNSLGLAFASFRGEIRTQLDVIEKEIQELKTEKLDRVSEPQTRVDE